ncbi:MAG: hypothetical protein QGH40_01040, partial [bacterium]|nr:hypothetical protein [bacterium]
KIALGVLSLLFFLGLLEIGLRVAGHLYSRRTPERFGQGSIIRAKTSSESADPAANGREKSDFTLLCVGDSYTFGGLSEFDETYPSYLQEIVDSNKTGKRIRIVNGGVCEYNSRQVRIRLPQLIKTYRPDAVILLVGSANKFNLAGFDLGGKNPILSAIRGLRLYKMGKIISVNLKGLFLKWKTRSSADKEIETGAEEEFGADGYAITTVTKRATDYIERMLLLREPSESYSHTERVWYLSNTKSITEGMFYGHQVLEKEIVSPELLCTLGFFYFQTGAIDKAIKILEMAMDKYPDSHRPKAFGALVYSRLGKEFAYQKNYDEAVKFLCKTIELDPYDHDNYYLLIKSYELQNKYKADELMSLMQDMAEKNPGLMDNALFARYVHYLRDKKKWETQLDAWLEEDLEASAAICRDQDVPLLIQNYPYPHTAANKALKSLADRHSLPFLEQCAEFEKLTNDANWSTYFLDDDHCTPAGHEVMARNVYRFLESKKVLP